MNSCFADALDLLTNGDYTSFEKLLKQNPQLLEFRRHNYSLLTFAVLNDRLKAVQYLNKKGLSFADGDKNNVTAVHWAVLADAEKCLKFMLKIPTAYETPWVLQRDRNGATPVHLAAKLGRIKSLKLLLDAVADPEKFYEKALDAQKQSPLHYGAATGQVECCELLLESSVELPPDQRDNSDQTALMCAAASVYPGAGNVVRLLGAKLMSIGKKAFLTARNKEGRTALHLAVLASNVEVIDILLDELQCQPDTFDNEKRTPLHYAAQRGHLVAVRKLINANARIATRDNYGVTPAHYASMAGHQLVLELLLRKKQGTEQEFYDKEKRSCLMWAIVNNQVETVKYLLNKFSYDVNVTDKYGYTAVHHAAHVGSTQIIKILFNHTDAWNINGADISNATPLHIAAGKGLTDVVRCLITLGAIKDCEDFQNRTPVFYACFGGQPHTLKVMLKEFDCEGTHIDSFGRTALHCAAFAGFVGCIEVLMEETKCEIGAEDVNQYTALHIACLLGKFDCVKVLMHYGAAVNAISRIEDKTPLDCAKLNGHKQIFDYLRLNGGLFSSELRNMAAQMIQKWWKDIRSRIKAVGKIQQWWRTTRK